MLAEMDNRAEGQTSEQPVEDVPKAPCPVCGFEMIAVRGSKHAVCANCGFKDSCCY